MRKAPRPVTYVTQEPDPFPLFWIAFVILMHWLWS